MSVIINPKHVWEHLKKKKTKRKDVKVIYNLMLARIVGMYEKHQFGNHTMMGSN